MKRLRNRPWCVCICMAAMAGGCRSAGNGDETAASASRVAASNSYLEAAVVDLLGGDTHVLRLAEPGMCPGHFDIRPSQVDELRRCRLLLRFDFQSSMDGRLANLTKRGLSIGVIRPPGGLCEPASYREICRQVADALVATDLCVRPAADARLAEIEARVREREAWCRRQVAEADWAGKAVVCSAHQEGFCRWLGLSVAATFSGADTASIGQIEDAIRQSERARVRLVIANLPEGRRLADALAKRLGVGVIVFGNFPTMRPDQSTFDDLLTANVSELVRAANP